MESPGRGATYSDIPPKEVLGVVTPPEEAVTLQSGQLRDSHTPTVWFRIATEVTKPHSCCHLQQLEQVYHLETQATAQARWQYLKASRHVLNQGGPIQQVDPCKISQETSLKSRTPSGRGNYQEGAGLQDVHILVTQRGEPLERSLEGIDIPPCTLVGFHCL